MARTLLATTKVTRAGVDTAKVAGTADGHSFRNNGNVWLEVSNVGAAPRDLTVTTPAQVAGLDIEEHVVTIPNGATRRIGPFPPAQFNQTDPSATGLVYINFPAGNEADLTVAAYTL